MRSLFTLLLVFSSFSSLQAQANGDLIPKARVGFDASTLLIQNSIDAHFNYLLGNHVRLQASGGYQFPISMDTAHLRNSIDNTVSGPFFRLGLNVVFHNRSKSKELIGILPEIIIGQYTHRNTLTIKDYYGTSQQPFSYSESYMGYGIKIYVNILQSHNWVVNAGTSLSIASPTFFSSINRYPLPGARSTILLLGISRNLY